MNTVKTVASENATELTNETELSWVNGNVTVKLTVGQIIEPYVKKIAELTEEKIRLKEELEQVDEAFYGKVFPQEHNNPIEGNDATEIGLRLKELQQAAAQLMHYLAQHCHPHVTAIVTGTSTELLEGILCVNKCEQDASILPKNLNREDKMKKITLPKGTILKLDGIPVELHQDTIVETATQPFCICKNGRMPVYNPNCKADSHCWENQSS